MVNNLVVLIDLDLGVLIGCIKREYGWLPCKEVVNTSNKRRQDVRFPREEGWVWAIARKCYIGKTPKKEMQTRPRPRPKTKSRGLIISSGRIRIVPHIRPHQVPLIIPRNQDDSFKDIHLVVPPPQITMLTQPFQDYDPRNTPTHLTMYRSKQQCSVPPLF